VLPAEELFQSTETVLSAVFHATGDALVMSRARDGLIYEVNDAAVRLLGYDREELRGRTVFEVDLWQDPRRRNELVKAAALTREPQQAELVLRTRSGDRRPTDEHCSRAATLIPGSQRADEDGRRGGSPDTAAESNTRPKPDESHRPGLCLKALANMTSTTSERHRRSQTSKHPRPFTDQCVIVYGDERAPHTRMFPDLAAETVTDQVLWTPARLRARGA
jgi:PAS domain S-box-containing protein